MGQRVYFLVKSSRFFSSFICFLVMQNALSNKRERKTMDEGNNNDLIWFFVGLFPHIKKN